MLRAMGALPWRKPAFGTPLNRSEPLTRGLLACWLCQDGGGTRLRDTTGRFHGTIPAGTVVWSADDRFRGRALRHPTGPVTPISVALPTLTQWTVEVWARRDNVAGYGAVLTQGNTRGFYTNTMSAGTYRIDWYDGGSHLSTTPLAAGVWQHLVVTYTAGTMRFYVHGRLDTTTAYSATPFQATLLSGEAGAGTFLGNISLLRVWQRALTPGDVRRLSQRPFAMFASPPRALPLLPDEGGVLVRTQASQTLQASANLTLEAEAALAQAGHLLLATSALLVRADAAVAQTGQTLQASLVLLLPSNAEAVLTQASQTLQASGTAAAVLSAQAVLTQASQTLQASGTVPVANTGAATLAQGSQTLAAIGVSGLFASAEAYLSQASQGCQGTGSLLLLALSTMEQGSQALASASIIFDPPELSRGVLTIAGFAHESGSNGSQWPAASAAQVSERLPLLDATFEPGVQQTPVVTRAASVGPAALDLAIRLPSVRLRFRWRYQGLEALLACALGYMPATLPEVLGPGVYRHLYELSPDLASEPWPSVDAQPPTARLVRRGTLAVDRQVSIWELVSGMVQTLILSSDGPVMTGEVVLVGARLRQRGTVNTRSMLRALPAVAWPTLLTHQSTLWLGEQSSSRALSAADAMCYTSLEMRLENQLEGAGSRRTDLEPEEYIRRSPPELTLTVTIPRYAVDTWLDAWGNQASMMAQLTFRGPLIGASATPYQQTWHLPSLAWSAVTPGPVAPGLPQVQHVLVGTAWPQQMAGMPALTHAGPLGLELLCGVAAHPLL
jgi:hypothetical protein